MRAPLLGVGQLRQQARAASRPIAAIQRQPQYMVGEVRILGQERAVQVRAKGVAIDTALTTIFAVVAVASQHASQGLRVAA